jgi:hypothetical protein
VIVEPGVLLTLGRTAVAAFSSARRITVILCAQQEAELRHEQGPGLEMSF